MHDADGSVHALSGTTEGAFRAWEVRHAGGVTVETDPNANALLSRAQAGPVEDAVARVGVAMAGTAAEPSAVAASITQGEYGTVDIELTLDTVFGGREIGLQLHYPTDEGQVVAGSAPLLHLEFVAFDDTMTPKEVRGTLAAVLRLAEDVRASQLTVRASEEDGGYLWGRLGMQAARPQALAKALHERLARGGELGWARGNRVPRLAWIAPFTPDQRAAIDRELAQVDGSLPQRLADLRVGGRNVGRDLLRWTNWAGTTTLDHPVFRERTRHFLGAT